MTNGIHVVKHDKRGQGFIHERVQVFSVWHDNNYAEWYLVKIVGKSILPQHLQEKDVWGCMAEIIGWKEKL